MSNFASADLLCAVRQFHDVTRAWHRSPSAHPPATVETTDGIAPKTLELHAMNFALWHHEDAARRPDADDPEVAGRKRCIDDLNARRNAAIEALDAMLLERLSPSDCQVTLQHTETPGTIVDRLSVLALRIVHAHDARWPSARLEILDEQYHDLFVGLDGYLARLQLGEARFKLYRQFKSDGLQDRCTFLATPEA